MYKKEFWFITDKGKVIINPIQFADYLESIGIFRYYIDNDKTKGYVFIKKIKKRFIVQTPVDEIKTIVKNDLLRRKQFVVASHLLDNIKYFEIKFLSVLTPRKIPTIKDDKKTCYLFYKNTAVKITKKEISLVSYKKLEGFVWINQVIKRDIKIKPESDGEYKTFVWRICGENKKRYYTFKSVIGFLLHTYKHQAKNRVIVFNDLVVSDIANGGSGKGIFHKAISHVKNIETIDGKSFDPGNRFAYENINVDTQLIFFDDVKLSFNLSTLFSIITEGIKTEAKNMKPIFIPFEDSPKISIATNYTLKGEGGSHQRRVFEVEMSDHYTATYNPEDEFGHLLFTDWDKGEWGRFDNYMIRAVQLYLKKGLIVSSTENLEQRKIIDNTNKDFFYMMKSIDFRESQIYFKTELKDKFIEEFPDYNQERWFKSRVFNRWVESYCKYEGLEFDNARYNGQVNLKIGPYKEGHQPLTKPNIKDIDINNDDLPF